jgi:hypothetical protein
MNNDSFFSTDRLVEFGLSIAMAQQMVRMMNQSMQDMYVPGSIQSMPQSQALPYYVAIDGQQVGPLGSNELMQLIVQQKVNKDSLCWIPGMPAWKPICEVPAVLKLIALAPPPLNP